MEGSASDVDNASKALRTHGDSLTPGKGHTGPFKETRPWRSPFTKVCASQVCAGVSF